MPDRRTRAMLVRFTPAEFDRVLGRAKDCGRTMARFVRETALGAAPRARPNHEADAILAQISRIGNNVNQLAHVANATDRLPAEEKLEAVLNEIRTLIRQLARDTRDPWPL